MNNTVKINVIFMMLLIVLVGVNGFFITRKRDEREKQAILKSIGFSFAVMMYVGIIEIMNGFRNKSFTFPMYYITIILVLGCSLNLIMYPIYLCYDNLEPGFIRNKSKEEKVKIYGHLINLDLLLLFLFLGANQFFKNFFNSISIPITDIGVFTCLFVEYMILLSMPKKKIIKEKEKQLIKKKGIIILSMLVITLIFGVVAFIVGGK